MAGGKELIGMVSKHAVQSTTNTMDIQAETSLEYIKLGIVQQQTRITVLEAEALAAQEQFTIMQSDLKKAVQQGLCDKPKAMGGEKWGTPKERGEAHVPRRTPPTAVEGGQPHRCRGQGARDGENVRARGRLGPSRAKPIPRQEGRDAGGHLGEVPEDERVERIHEAAGPVHG